MIPEAGPAGVAAIAARSLALSAGATALALAAGLPAGHGPPDDLRTAEATSAVARLFGERPEGA